MTKKKEFKSIFENLEPESSDAHPQVPEPAKDRAGQEVSVQEEGQVQDQEARLRAEMPAGEQVEGSGPEDSAPGRDQVAGEEKTLVGEIPPTGPSAPAPEGENPDELLEDVRKSLLVEEEAREHEEQPKWWRRIGRSSRKKKTEEEPVKAPEEINLPALGAIQAAEGEGIPGPETEPVEYQEELDELIDILAAEEETVDKDLVPFTEQTPATPQPEPAVEPEKPLDIEELKKQAFQPRQTEGGEESLTEVRSVALEGDEEVFVEVEASKPDVLEERLSAVENALKPYQRYINFTLAFLGLVMALTAAFLIYNAYQRSVVQNTPPTQVSNLPFPTSVSLPGGWQFNLGKGSLTADGSWNPKGAEWLQGTEVCRWVALPYSRQLEAVIRTLNPKDPIELGMSNNDQLVYNVYSIKQMSPEEMKSLDSNSPCLLIVLAEPNAEKRWVLTALP